MKLRSLIKRRYAFLAVLCLVAGVAVVFWLHGNRRPVTSYQGQVLTNSTSTPSETRPTTGNFAWRGSAGDPRYIKLPSIAAEGFIEKVGIDQHNAVGVPDNIYMAAWFAKSMPPGKRGLSVIDGHVTGIHGPGIFRYLNHLKVGDVFNVTLGNGKVLNYQVMQNSSVPLDQVAGLLFSQDPAVASQLNLITCGGQFDYQTHSYNQREIVTAKLTSQPQS